MSGFLPFVASSGRTFRIRADMDSASVFCEESEELLEFDRESLYACSKIPEGFFISLDETRDVFVAVISEIIDLSGRVAG